MSDVLKGKDLVSIEEAIWVLAARTDNPAYDFQFDAVFACRRPWHRDGTIAAVARLGAPQDYSQLISDLSSHGIELINSNQQHLNGSELPNWYPLIENITPKSIWFDAPPPAKIVAERIGWPVFVKGARQTSRHDPDKCIAHSSSDYERIVELFLKDDILHWQRCVVREFVKLRPVSGNSVRKIQPSFEFRTFWWKGQLVAAGPYWSQFANYKWTEAERDACYAVGLLAASRIDCPFLVIDLAQTADGKWIVIECNDAQESGYAGVSPIGLWQEIIRVEKSNAQSPTLAT